jgi:hypothetical protein
MPGIGAGKWGNNHVDHARFLEKLSYRIETTRE